MKELKDEISRLHAENAALQQGYDAARLEIDHLRGVTKMVARWYMVDKDGVATLCTDMEDAEQEAKDANLAWPHRAPHRAVQLVEVGTSAVAGESCLTCIALARTVMLDQVSFDRKPDCYGIRQITNDEGIEEWEDIRTSPDVAREEANDMMATGRGEIYEVVPLWTTPQPSPAPQAADSVLEDAARLEIDNLRGVTKSTLLAQPVAWMVYLPSIDTQHLYYSQEDMGYVDDVTNHADAEVTPLYEMAAPKAEVAPAGEYPPLPEPAGKIQFPAHPYEDAWVSSMDAYDESQMCAYADATCDMRAQAAPQPSPTPQADSQPASVLTSETGGESKKVLRVCPQCKQPDKKDPS